MIDKIDYIYIQINDAMKRKAELMSKGRRQNWESSKHIHDFTDYYGALGELSIRRLLYEKGRQYSYNEIEGKSDGGVDLIINAGTVNVKASNISPELYWNLISKENNDDRADYFIQCFIEEDECIFVGIEARGNLIREENLKEVKSNRYKENSTYMAYKLPVRTLSIKPYMLISDNFSYTIPKL